MYFEDISSVPRLTREEEVELAGRIQKGDREALNKMVEGNLRFVVSVAKKYSSSQLPLVDLINEGNLGLIKAAEKYDPEKGVKFITYAVWWITAAIKRAIAKQRGVVELPIKHGYTIYKINKIQEELSKKMGQEPTKEEVAEALNLSPGFIRANIMASKQPIYLDAPTSEADESPNFKWMNTLESGSDIEGELLAEQRKDRIVDLLGLLDDREKTVISNRFGLGLASPLTLREVGAELGLSRERVRQIEGTALEKLRALACESDF